MKTALFVFLALSGVAQAKMNYVKTGHGPGIVLLHSMGGTHADWDREAARLSRTHTVIAVDLPGHGASPPPARADLDAIARGVGDIIRKEKLQPAIVIGHSFGGTLAGHLAAIDPGVVRAVVIVDSLIGPLPIPAAGRQQLRADVLRDHDGTMRAFYGRIARADQMDRLMATVLKLDGKLWADYLDALATQPVPDGGRAIKVPLLLLGSKLIEQDPAKEKQMLADAGYANVADLTLVRFDTLHWIQWEQPEKFDATIDRFLQRVEKR